MVETLLPNLIIAGAPKAGTTSLFRYLSYHQEVFPSSLKETNYFVPLRYGARTEAIERYESYFAGQEGQRYRMEATPKYLYGGPQLVARMKETLPDAKVIISLRNPVDRLFSSFVYKRSYSLVDTDLTFPTFLKECDTMAMEDKLKAENFVFFAREAGYYADYLPDWHRQYGEALKVVFFDDLKSEARTWVKGICHWLDLDPGLYDEISFGVENKSVDYKNRRMMRFAFAVDARFQRLWNWFPRFKGFLSWAHRGVNVSQIREKMDPELRTELEEHYRPYNRNLKEHLEAMDQADKLPDWVEG